MIALLHELFGATDADTAGSALPHLNALRTLAARISPKGDGPIDS